MSNTLHTAADAAQDALHALCVGDATLSGLDLISNGTPGSFPADCMWVAHETEDHTQAWGTSAATQKRESFLLRVCILSTHYTTDAKAVRDLNATFGRAFEHLLSDNITLSGTVMLAGVETVEHDEAVPSENQRQFMRTYRVRCDAWLA